MRRKAADNNQVLASLRSAEPRVVGLEKLTIKPGYCNKSELVNPDGVGFFCFVFCID